MRTAVLALTAQGAETARRVQMALPDADVYLSKRAADALADSAQDKAAGDTAATSGSAAAGSDATTGGSAAAGSTATAAWLAGVTTFPRIVQATADVFTRYDALVFLMATGIVVRSIAPLIRSKLADPAVVVLDEQAHHVISLLSGHVGGANELTRQLAAALGSDPVITTATDVEGKVAPDAIAGRLGLVPEPHGAILAVNRAVLEGAQLRYIIDDALPLADFYQEQLAALGDEVFFRGEGILPKEGETRPIVEVVITRTPAEFPAHQKRGGLFLRPERLIAGVGCRRGTSWETIRAALVDACGRIGVPVEGISCLASTAVKRDEVGLLTIADVYGIPIHFFENEALAAVIERYGLRESEFVKKTIGIGNVAESAALAEAGQRGRIALGKTKYEKVTVALVWQRLQ
ncbi:MAG: cobalamin biosynthesis protein [Veillonellaceae bacterium]|uniref:cobalt-precorrin 5A hydrolase n=1 Tax=uncultured Selenomonas sp. TaxID=159275 RepID=UPI0025CC4973|nr:cobalamin biosynthesis protein [uncultured Selenomonas sp.]MCI7539377.1 cobalamin biosynthesis protein [Veillonellaceae bacterium]